MNKRRVPKITSLVLVSDSTGDMGERFLSALTTQFPSGSFRIQIFSFVRAKKDWARLSREFSRAGVIIFHATIFKELKTAITTTCRKKAWPCFDLTGPAMTFLERHSGIEGAMDVRSLHALDQTYYQRIAALNYTIEQDDGANSQRWDDADIVLLGVSRTSKTPTSIYLANKGFKVANVPIIAHMEVPSRLRRSPRLRMVGLTIHTDKLLEVRKRRAAEEKIPKGNYTDSYRVDEEIRFAESLFLELRVPVIDVTNLAIEETAALVLKALAIR